MILGSNPYEKTPILMCYGVCFTMEPIPIPVIPVGDMDNTALVILPDLNMEALDTVSFEIEDEVLMVTCRFDESHDDSLREYPVEITDSNRPTVESMDKIAVMDAEQVDPETLASHPDEQEKLEDLMEAITSPGAYSPLEMMSTNGTNDDDPNTPGETST
jgi:hypothetical protein